MYVCSDIRSKDDFLNPCRPCELLPCHVRGTFTLLEGLLTSAASRLNSRDSLRERAKNANPNNTFYMSSLKSGQKGSHNGITLEKASFRSTASGPTAVSVSVQQSTIADYAPCQDGSNKEPTTSLVDVEKQVRSLCHSLVVSELIRSGVNCHSLFR
jgi:hypothetical protein